MNDMTRTLLRFFRSNYPQEPERRRIEDGWMSRQKDSALLVGERGEIVDYVIGI